MAGESKINEPNKAFLERSVEESIYRTEINPLTDQNSTDLDIADPRKIDTWKRFISKNSPTYSNAHASAEAAGFDRESAASFVKSPWFRRRIRRFAMPNTAEEKLRQYLSMDIDLEKRNKDDTEWARLQMNALQFTLKTLKKHVYSERVELTGKKGGPIKSQVTHEDYERVNRAIKEIIGDSKGQEE